MKEKRRKSGEREEIKRREWKVIEKKMKDRRVMEKGYVRKNNGR